MMKNNLLTEITHIKKLMGINESTDQECEEQLEKAGYIVYNPREQKNIDLGCEEKEKIKCVKTWLDNNGISSSNYRVGKYKSFCYILVDSNDSINQDGENLKKKTWTFWDNGDVLYIRTFDTLQTNPDNNLKYSQVQYKGKYKCEGSDLKWEDLNYEGVYEFKKYDKLFKLEPTYMIKKSDGTDQAKVSMFASKDATFNSSHFN
jgi:hypothetical protein